jgi:hypothetical protein
MLFRSSFKTTNALKNSSTLSSPREYPLASISFIKEVRFSTAIVRLSAWAEMMKYGQTSDREMKRSALHAVCLQLYFVKKFNVVLLFPQK